MAGELFMLTLFAGSAHAIRPVPCSGPFVPSKTNTLCSVRDVPINGAHYDASFRYGLFSDVYPGDPPDFDVTTEAEAVALMSQSAAILNQYSTQYSIVYGFNPNEPPLLFGPKGNTYFKIAYEYKKVEKEVFTDYSGFLESSGTVSTWEIVPVLKVVPSDAPNIWVTFAPSVPKVPAPAPIAGVVLSYSMARSLRRRIKLDNAKST